MVPTRDIFKTTEIQYYSNTIMGLFISGSFIDIFVVCKSHCWSFSCACHLSNGRFGCFGRKVRIDRFETISVCWICCTQWSVLIPFLNTNIYWKRQSRPLCDLHAFLSIPRFIVWFECRIKKNRNHPWFEFPVFCPYIKWTGKGVNITVVYGRFLLDIVWRTLFNNMVCIWVLLSREIDFMGMVLIVW